MKHILIHQKRIRLKFFLTLLKNILFVKTDRGNKATLRLKKVEDHARIFKSCNELLLS